MEEQEEHNKPTGDACQNDNKNEKSRDFIHWRQMLDLAAAEAMEFDWYKTETFNIFIEAIDFGANTKPIDASSVAHLKQPPAADPTITRMSTTSSHQEADIALESSTQSRNYSDETILSVEALKILYELPNLSHLSSTASSFIFPSRPGENASRISKSTLK